MNFLDKLNYSTKDPFTTSKDLSYLQKYHKSFLDPHNYINYAILACDKSLTEEAREEYKERCKLMLETEGIKIDSQINKLSDNNVYDGEERGTNDIEHIDTTTITTTETENTKDNKTD